MKESYVHEDVEVFGIHKPNITIQTCIRGVYRGEVTLPRSVWMEVRSRECELVYKSRLRGSVRTKQRWYGLTVSSRDGMVTVSLAGLPVWNITVGELLYVLPDVPAEPLPFEVDCGYWSVK